MFILGTSAHDRSAYDQDDNASVEKLIERLRIHESKTVSQSAKGDGAKKRAYGRALSAHQRHTAHGSGCDGIQSPPVTEVGPAPPSLPTETSPAAEAKPAEITELAILVIAAGTTAIPDAPGYCQ